MISRLLYALENGFGYIKKHPHILFVFVLLVAVPLLFLYTGQQFLEVGRANQDRLQKDRVGLLQDATAAMLAAVDYDATRLQSHIETLAEQNPDIEQFGIVRAANTEFTVVAAIDRDQVGERIADTTLYERSALSVDESLVFEFSPNGERTWLAFRTVPSGTDTYFVFTQVSLATIDAAFAQKERGAYYSLVFVYLVFIAITFWLIRVTDYRYLYLETKKANQTKDLFTNMIAHELRAPLTAVRGYAELLETEQDAVARKKYTTRIKNSSERLITIVSDLLDVARIQSGKLTTVKESVNISAVVTAVLDELRVSADEKNIGLTSAGTDVVHIATADEKRMHQVITNLVSNAIKYTKEGTIEIALTENPIHIELRVKDTGMGIGAADQQKLFAPFFRVQSTDVDAITGTGLGMWITRQMIELMGATVGVESIKGVGTHIVVTIPK